MKGQPFIDKVKGNGIEQRLLRRYISFSIYLNTTIYSLNDASSKFQNFFFFFFLSSVVKSFVIIMGL